nr:structural protein [Sobelivirales sp.]
MTKSKKVQMVVALPQPKTKRSTNRKRRRSRRINNFGNQVSSSKSMGYKLPPAIANNFRRLEAFRGAISPEGMEFLKCAFAPPDFSGTTFSGVPDCFRGMSLTRKQRNTTTAINFANGRDYHFLLCPVPGVSYFSVTTAAGVAPTAATVWQANYYPDSVNMYNPGGVAGGSTNVNVTAFRFISNHFELIPTANQMTWSGSITAFKSDVRFKFRQGNAGDICTIAGLESFGQVASQAAAYTSDYSKGIYIGAFNTDSVFPFYDIQEGFTQVPSAVAPSDFGSLAVPTIGFTGFDNSFETAYIRVSGLTQDSSCVIKTWNCQEAKVQTTSILYGDARFSCRDQAALELYRLIINSLPVAVPYTENESFWKRVLDLIRSATKMGSVLPGPYGMASTGVNMLAEAVNQLAF